MSCVRGVYGRVVLHKYDALAQEVIDNRKECDLCARTTMEIHVYFSEAIIDFLNFGIPRNKRATEIACRS